jgi:hypothetical protein
MTHRLWVVIAGWGRTGTRCSGLGRTAAAAPASARHRAFRSCQIRPVLSAAGELWRRLELLSELVPQARVVALLVNPSNSIPERLMLNLQEAARAKGVQLHILEAGTESEIDAAFETLVKLHIGGLTLGPDPFLNSRREQLIRLAAGGRLPGPQAQ